MRLVLCIKQDVSRLDVTMQNAVFVRVMHGARYLRNEFRRLPDRHRLAPDYFVKLAPFNELHAEVTSPLALANFVNRDYAWMVEAGRRFRFHAEPFDVRLRGPPAKPDYF